MGQGLSTAVAGCALLSASAASSSSPPLPKLDFQTFVQHLNGSRWQAGGGAGVLGAPDTSQILPTLWSAPFFSGGGYCSEAIAFMQGLEPLLGDKVAAQQHGDSMSNDWFEALPKQQQRMLKRLVSQRPTGKHIAVCHSEPGAWHVQGGPHYSTSPCPAPSSAVKVGRTMFETDRLPSGWPQRLQEMDELWVPTQFSEDIFAAAGIPSEKLLVVPEAVDTAFFSPLRFQEGGAGPQSVGALQAREGCKRAAPPSSSSSVESIAAAGRHSLVKGHSLHCPYRFLSVGKFERRKNLGALLRAFLKEFFFREGGEAGQKPGVGGAAASGGVAAEEPHVQLVILTSAYHTGTDFQQMLRELLLNEVICPDESLAAALAERGGRASRGAYVPAAGPVRKDDCLAVKERAAAATAAAGEGGETVQIDSLPSIQQLLGLLQSHILILHSIPQQQLPPVYALTDALVQPSRGEGWGRPQVEALSMQMPVLSTNWSGMTAYLSEKTGFPVPVRELAPIPDGAFRGHLQAEIDEAGLRAAMRQVVTQQELAAERGRAGRELMEQLYRPEGPLAEFLLYNLQRLSLQHHSKQQKAARGAGKKGKQDKGQGDTAGGKAEL